MSSLSPSSWDFLPVFCLSDIFVSSLVTLALKSHIDGDVNEVVYIETTRYMVVNEEVISFIRK